MTRAEVVKKYGPIDFASKIWPNQNRFMTMLEITEGLFPNWYVLNTKMPVRHIYCNIDIKEPLSRALAGVVRLKLNDRLYSFDGCFSIRSVRGEENVFSAHSYGLAFDLNAAMNPLGSGPSKTFVSADGIAKSVEVGAEFYDVPDLVKCFTDVGFYWGGDFKTRKDPMHFSWTGW